MLNLHVKHRLKNVRCLMRTILWWCISSLQYICKCRNSLSIFKQCNIKLKAVPGLSTFADDSTVQQAVEEAGHQDVRLTFSQLGNDREELPAWRSIPEKHTHTHTHAITMEHSQVFLLVCPPIYINESGLKNPKTKQVISLYNVTQFKTELNN